MGCIKIHLQKVYLIVPSKRKYAKKKGSFQIEDLKRRLILLVKRGDFKSLQKAQKGSYPMRLQKKKKEGEKKKPYIVTLHLTIRGRSL